MNPVWKKKKSTEGETSSKKKLEFLFLFSAYRLMMLYIYNSFKG